MVLESLTVHLPGPLYERLARRAVQTHRSIEAELVEVVMTSLPEEPGELPHDMAEAIAGLHLLDDEALWRAARTRLSTDDARRLEDLHLKRQAEGLSTSDAESLAALMTEYTRTMLVRARASSLLAQRGHDVSSLLREHEP